MPNSSQGKIQTLLVIEANRQKVGPDRECPKIAFHYILQRTDFMKHFPQDISNFGALLLFLHQSLVCKPSKKLYVAPLLNNNDVCYHDLQRSCVTANLKIKTLQNINCQNSTSLAKLDFASYFDQNEDVQGEQRICEWLRLIL